MLPFKAGIGTSVSGLGVKSPPRGANTRRGRPCIVASIERQIKSAARVKSAGNLGKVAPPCRGTTNAAIFSVSQ